MRGLRDLIPRALEGQKESTDARLKELGGELRSLKLLVGNRVGGGGGTSVGPSPSGAQSPIGRPFLTLGDRTAGSGATVPRDASANLGLAAGANGASDGKAEELGASPSSAAAAAPAPGGTGLKREGSSSRGFESRQGSRAAIPAWQMAASGKGKAEGAASGSASGGEREAGSEAAAAG